MGEAQIQPQNRVKFISKKLICPAIPTPYTLRNLKISSLDKIMPSLYVPLVFFYPSTEIDQRAKNAERIKQLEKSLSENLNLFYPLAGRYVKDNLLVDCNDGGVEFIETQVSGRLAPLLGRDVDGRNLSHFLPSYGLETPTCPLVAVQCNMFECGGLAIGFSITHRIADGFSLTKFLDGWATACREGLHKVDRPSFDLSTLLPTREVMTDIKIVPRFISGLKVVSKTFVFDAPAIEHLKAIARGGLGDAKVLKRQPSRVQLVTAIIWKALIKVAQTKHGQLRPSVISHTMNMRGRTALPISYDCCGNLFRPTMVQFTPDKKKSKVEFHELVSLVSDAITNAVTDCAKPQNGDDLYSMVTNGWREVREEFDKENVDSYPFSSLCGMPLNPDFGWGKAARVTSVDSRVEMVMLTDTRDEGGIEAWVSLEVNVMLLFQQDPDIIALTSHVE